MSAAKPSVWALLNAHMRADPRKTAVLLVLGVVLLVLFGRWYWTSSGPESAEAATNLAMPTGANPSLAPATGTAQARPARIKLVQHMARELARDPFILDLQRYPPGHLPPDEGKPKQNGEVEDPIEAAARMLSLDSTLCGPAPMACINGKFLKPGQRVNGFVLERIEPTRVVLAREGVKVELFLK